MAVIGSVTLNGFTYPEAYVRMGACPQVYKDEGFVRVSLDLHGNKAAYLAIKGSRGKALCPRYLIVDLLSEAKAGKTVGTTAEPMGGFKTLIVASDIVRLWGDTPVNPVIADNAWPTNAFAQVWALIMTTEKMTGMVADV